MRACNCARASPFQSRTCVGCDLVILYQRDVLPVVSIHAPAWGATSLASHADASATAVSIHAPAWGATGTRAARRDAMPVSIHAPAWGATGRHRGIHPDHLRFNPRTRVGCDLPERRCRPVTLVSIHAPAWGATLAVLSREPAQAVSIHAPRGVRRRTGQRTGGCRSSFNPRTRVGCDEVLTDATQPRARFQSTHPRGVRPPTLQLSIRQIMFQSTHPRGVRPGA